jgi:phage FluMu gp28-like protein
MEDVVPAALPATIWGAPVEMLSHAMIWRQIIELYIFKIQ